jgi:hypothetical protein
MCKLEDAREAILLARKAVLEAVHEYDWTYALKDTYDLLQDAGAQLSGEIGQRKAGIIPTSVALQI